MVVDDNSAAADGIVRLLQLSGNEAYAVYSGKSALEAAPIYKPDTILVDLVMPDMSGIDLAKQFRERGVKSELIALTAFARSKLADEIKAAGFDGIIQKPATADALLWTLQRKSN